MTWNHLFLSFDGRTSRRDFWICFAALFAIGLLASVLPLIGALTGLALLYPWTALMAKRLHDFGRPGWLVLIPAVPAAVSGALALFAALAMSTAATMPAGIAAAGLAAVISTLAVVTGLIFLLWAGLNAGDAHANAYGARPHPYGSQPCGTNSRT